LIYPVKGDDKKDNFNLRLRIYCGWIKGRGRQGRVKEDLLEREHSFLKVTPLLHLSGLLIEKRVAE